MGGEVAPLRLNRQLAASYLAGLKEPRTHKWDNLGHNHTTLLLVQTTAFF